MGKGRGKGGEKGKAIMGGGEWEKEKKGRENEGGREWREKDTVCMVCRDSPTQTSWHRGHLDLCFTD